MAENYPKTDFAFHNHLEERRVSVLWTIDKFSLRHQKTKECIISPVIRDSYETTAEWCLVLYPSGLNEDHKDFVSVVLELNNAVTEEVEANYVLSIIDSQGLHQMKTEKKEVLVLGQEPEGVPRFVAKTELLESDKGLLSDDTLALFCEINFTADVNTDLSVDRFGSNEVPNDERYESIRRAFEGMATQ